MPGLRDRCIRALLHSCVRAFVHSYRPVLARLCMCPCVAVMLLAASAGAQVVPGTTRLAVLLADDRRDVVTARIAIRALGRLERPALIPDLVPALGAVLSEHRAEAANAIAQAAQGWARPGEAKTAAGTLSPASVLSTLAARLDIEEDPSVRAAICG